MDEIRAMAGPVFQKHFEKVEGERQAAQARADAAKAAKQAAEDEARKQAEAQKAAQEPASKDAEMTDAPKPEVEEAGDPE